MLYRRDRDAVAKRPAEWPDEQRSAARGRRKGAAMVEFAAVAPILFLILLGMFEMGRGLMVAELLMEGARRGCRVGIIQGKNSDDVKKATNDWLAGVGIAGDTATVLVNDVADAGGPSDPLTNATTGTEVTVSVRVPVSKITWMPVGTFLGSASTLNISGQFTMRRE